jgi:hypothetical protein
VPQLNDSISLASTTVALVASGSPPPGTIKNENVIVYNNHAYVVTGTTTPTLCIYDVSNPLNPILLGQLVGAGSYLSDIQWPYLYMGGSGSTYAYIVNVSNPYNPTLTGSYNFTGTAGAVYNVAISGNYLYCSTQSRGLNVLDVSNPSSPSLVFQEGVVKSLGVCIANGMCYTTNYQTTAPWTVRYLKTWSLATPSTPSLINTYTLPAGSKPGRVQVFGNTAYVADFNTNSIQIVDVTTPTAPNYLASLFASAVFLPGAGVSLQNNLCYITSGSNSTYGGAIDVFDISNLSSPTLLHTYTSGVPNSAFGPSTINGNYLYVADYGVAPGNAGSLDVYTTAVTSTSAVSTKNLSKLSAQLLVTGSSTSGTWYLQGSNDNFANSPPINFSNISTISISSNGTYLQPSIDTEYQWVRMSYMNSGLSSSPTTVTANFKFLGYDA